MIIPGKRIQQIGQFLLLASLLAPRTVLAQQHKIRFGHLSFEGERWQSGQVYEILQDKQGFMWFGTRNGLYKYDGYYLLAYRNDSDDPTSLSDSRVRVIHQDHSGALWIGTMGGGLNRFVPETEQFIRYQYDENDLYSLGGNDVRVVFQDRDGNLWVGTKGGGAYRLLIAEDVADSRWLLVKFLQPLGFEMREAVNGQEAVEIWQEWQPHLIWMDMRMPVMDGREATRRIRSGQAQEADDESVVIVALTASAFEEERAEILASGCDDFVRKPFQEHEIFEMLHKHLGVDFVYAAEPESVIDQGVLITNRLQALPQEWRHALQDAAEETNPRATSVVIQQIGEQDAPLAEALAGLVKTYRFDTLQELLGEAE